jgi:hypothetical protein
LNKINHRRDHSGQLEAFCMPTYIPVSEPKSFLSQNLVLGVPLAIWAMALLLIAISAHFNTPVISFDPQELLTPF